MSRQDYNPRRRKTEKLRGKSRHHEVLIHSMGKSVTGTRPNGSSHHWRLHRVGGGRKEIRVEPGQVCKKAFRLRTKLAPGKYQLSVDNSDMVLHIIVEPDGSTVYKHVNGRGEDRYPPITDAAIDARKGREAEAEARRIRHEMIEGPAERAVAAQGQVTVHGRVGSRK